MTTLFLLYFILAAGEFDSVPYCGTYVSNDQNLTYYWGSRAQASCSPIGSTHEIEITNTFEDYQDIGGNLYTLRFDNKVVSEDAPKLDTLVFGTKYLGQHYAGTLTTTLEFTHNIQGDWLIDIPILEGGFEVGSTFVPVRLVLCDGTPFTQISVPFNSSKTICLKYQKMIPTATTISSSYVSRQDNLLYFTVISLALVTFEVYKGRSMFGLDN